MDENAQIIKYRNIRAEMRKFDRLIMNSDDSEEVAVYAKRREQLVSELKDYSTIVIAKYNKNNQSMFTYIPADSGIKPGDILTVYKTTEGKQHDEPNTERTDSTKSTEKNTNTD